MRLRKSLNLKLVLLVLLHACGTLTRVYAEETVDPFARFTSDYAEGAYRQALASLKTIVETPENRERLLYARAKCHFALKEYEQATGLFMQIEPRTSGIQDLYFQIGQAHYALMALSEARQYFEQSLSLGQKVNACRYYLGKIEQLRGNRREAESLYSALAVLGPSREEYPLLAAVQVAEIKYQRIDEQAPQEQLRFVAQEVIPAYERVLTHENAGELVTLAGQRLSALHKRFRPEGARNWGAELSQDLVYDSNIIAKIDEASLAISHRGGFYAQTSAAGKIGLRPRHELTVTPHFVVQSQIYANRHLPEVYTNDQVLTVAGLTLGYVHDDTSHWGIALRNRETQVEFQLGYIARDYRQVHQLNYFGNSTQLSIGEKMQFFPQGATAFKVRYSDQPNYDPQFSGKAIGLGLSQELQLGEGGLLVVELGGENKTAGDPHHSINTLELLTHLRQARFWRNYGFEVSLALLAFDPVSQREARGLEHLLDLSQSFNYAFANQWSVKGGFSWIDKKSRDSEYFAYRKHLLQLGVSYVF